MSSSPIKFHVSDTEHSAAEPTAVAVDVESMETESLCPYHRVDVEDGEDNESVSECVACNDRERFALVDSLPVTVLNGNIISIFICDNNTVRIISQLCL